MPEIKKLIEVSLPLKAINDECAREKSIRHGHPSTLHLWWARRPLAAARAALWASLVDDPASHPELFPTEEDQAAERRRLHNLLAELIKWENTSNEKLMDQARAEIRKYMGDQKVVFLDPFAGGGSIPLEAQRLGMEAHAHDLNPVAVMINKAMIEIPPKFANVPPINPEARKSLRGDAWPGSTGLAEDVRYYGQRMKEEAFRRIGHLYPKAKLPDGGEATVIAWIWARTIKCPNPACARETPLVKGFELSKKAKKEAYVQPAIENGEIVYKIKIGKDAPKGTVNRKGATCFWCKTPVGFPYIRDEGKAGRMGNRLIAIVAEGNGGRVYLEPDPAHIKIADLERPEDFPDANLPHNPRDFKTPNYGMDKFSDLFTPRQLTALTTFRDLVSEAMQKAESDAIAAGLPDDGIGLKDGGSCAKAYGEAVGVYLAFVIDKLADYNSAVCSWHSSKELFRNTFGRQAIAMIWDYAEANFFSESSGCFDNMLDWVVNCVKSLPSKARGQAKQREAQGDADLENVLISTDPPYYDNIGYADLSDFFYIWTRKNLKNVFPDIFRTILVPKTDELVATPYRFDGDRKKAREFFEEGMKQAFAQMRRAARDDAPVTIYYAFKQDEDDGEKGEAAGWETMLSAIIESGFAITGTWPMRTELANRQVASGANALASSIVLVCRKRPEDAPGTTRRGFLDELKKSLPQALKRLRAANIAPVDMAQASIGPGMAVYSKYSKVLDADGTPMSVREALRAINVELDAYLSDQDGGVDAASRFCVDLYSQKAYNAMKYGEADVLARARNTSIARLDDMGVLRAEKGLVRLLTREELPKKPPINSRDCLWAVAQYLVKFLDEKGIPTCAELVAAIPGQADRARDLVYRLYAIAERNKWAGEAFAYNSLITSWREITEEALIAGRKMEAGDLFS